MQDTKRVLDIRQSGSSELRNQFLNDWKDKVYGIALRHSRKFLRKPSEDEVSVSLEALNEAIDHFDENRYESFELFAKRVIINKLVDYFRAAKLVERTYITYEDGQLTQVYDQKVVSDYKNKEVQAEFVEQRREEMSKFMRLMGNLGCSLEDILKSKPKHTDSREMIRQLALNIVKSGLGERLLKENPPSRELIKLIGIDRRTLKRYRPYLFAWIVVTLYEFPLIKSYLGLNRERA